MTFKKSLLVIAISTVFLTACAENQNETKNSQSKNTANAAINDVVMSESEKANQLFDSIFNASVDRDPVSQTYLGIKKRL